MIYQLKDNESLNGILMVAKPFDIIYLANKVYNEKVKITIPNLTIIGDIDSSIENKDYYNKIHEDNKEFLTVRTYTVMVQADNVKLEKITIKNNAVPNSTYGQAVALHVLGDHFVCNNCKIYGAQDTLLSGPIPDDLTIRYKDLLPIDELSTKKSHQYFTNCYIEGDVDFIFGCGIALFEDCEIHSIGKGYISAPSHPYDYTFGFVFLNCKLTCEAGMTSNVYLGRPWRDYGQAAFINCATGAHIKAEGFHYWNENRAKTCKLYNYKTVKETDLAKFANNLSENEILDYSAQNILNS